MDFYILGIAFAYIGGAMALQSLREMVYVVKHGGAHHANPVPAMPTEKKGLWILASMPIRPRPRTPMMRMTPHAGPLKPFNEMKESSGAKGELTHTPAHSRTLAKAEESRREAKAERVQAQPDQGQEQE